MKRREFIAGVCGAAAAPAACWPLVAHAQQQDGRVRRIGVLMAVAENDPFGQPNLLTLRQTLEQLGWIEGRNLHSEIRYAAVDLSRMHANINELVRLAPDVIVVGGAAATTALQRQTKTIPIVFVSVGDPIASGVVASIARPEGNTT